MGCVITSASDFATPVAEATFHIANSDGGGTCFLVRRQAPDSALYLVTAAHVLEAMEKSPAAVPLRERRPDGSYQQTNYPIKLRCAGKRLWVRHAEQDVAVLRLSDPPPVPVPALSSTALADEARFGGAGLHLCSSVFVLTYPYALPQHGGGFPFARQAVLASYPLLPIERYPTYAASFTTFGGDSGGPVFLADRKGRPLLIGVVVGAFRQEEKVDMEFQKGTIYHPFGMGLVVHAQFIRELIEQAAKQAARDSGKKVQSPNPAHAVDGGISPPPEYREPAARRH